MRPEVLRSDTAWPVPVNGIGQLVHTRQLQKQDLANQIRALEQQHLESLPATVETVQPCNPYAWPLTSDIQQQVTQNMNILC